MECSRASRLQEKNLNLIINEANGPAQPHYSLACFPIRFIAAFQFISFVNFIPFIEFACHSRIGFVSLAMPLIVFAAQSVTISSAGITN